MSSKTADKAQTRACTVAGRALTLRDTHSCEEDTNPKALSRCCMARSQAFMNLYLRKSASAKSQRRRHLSKLPPLPACANQTPSSDMPQQEGPSECSLGKHS